jgi:microcin C transport system permease protein
MAIYILKRILLMIPTLFGVMLLTFAVIQFVPGGPIERIIAQIQGTAVDATARFGGGQGGEVGSAGGAQNNPGEMSGSVKYRGAQGLDPDFIKKLEKQFGFDKPAPERFWLMMKNYVTFDFGQSYFRSRPVVDLIIEKMPVSISLGIWLAFITNAVSIPLGIRKAVREGSIFDVWTSGVIIVAYAIPSFIFAVLLIVLFAGGSYLSWFPLRGLVSDNFAALSWPEKIADYAWHLVLPLTALGISGFAMLIVISSFPGTFLSAFFAGSLLIEQIFSLDGLGYLMYKAAIDRDYPVIFADLYIFTLFGLMVALISDLTYTWIDPRIDFEAREL